MVSPTFPEILNNNPNTYAFKPNILMSISNFLFLILEVQLKVL
jgi:hypothetical protein